MFVPMKLGQGVECTLRMSSASGQGSLKRHFSSRCTPAVYKRDIGGLLAVPSAITTFFRLEGTRHLRVGLAPSKPTELPT